MQQLQPLEPENDTVDPVAGLNLNDTAVRSPLIVRGATIGTLGIYDPSGQPVSPEKQYLLESISQQVAEALERARLFEETEIARTQVEQALAETQRRTEELAIINGIVTKLSSSLDMQTSMQIVAEGLADSLAVEQVRVTLLDESKEYLTIMAENFDPDKTESALGLKIPLAGNELTQQVMQTRKPVIITDVKNDPRVGPVRDMLLTQKILQLFILPMLSGNEVIGTVGIDILEENQTLTAEQMQLAETIVSQAATAVQSSRLFTQVEERAAELATINAISEVASSQLELDALIETVGMRLYETFNSQSLYIALYEEKSQRITFPFFPTKGAGRLDVPAASLDGNGGFTAQIIKSRQPMLINTFSDEEAVSKGARVVDTGDEIDTYLGVPMIVGDKVVGVIGMNDYSEDRSFTQSDQRLLLTLAGTVGVAIQKAQLFVETEERAKELAIINAISEAASSQLELDALIETVGLRLYETFHSENIYIALYDERTSDIDFPFFYTREEGSSELPSASLDEGGGFTAKIIKSGKPILLAADSLEKAEAQGAKIIESADEFRSITYAGVPMVVGNKVIGVIGMNDRMENRVFTEADQNLLLTLAGTVGVAIQNAQLFVETQKRAERERLVNEINQKIQNTTSVESALQMAVQELGKAFGAKHTAVQLSLAPKKDPKNGANGSTKRSISNES